MPLRFYEKFTFLVNIEYLQSDFYKLQYIYLYNRVRARMYIYGYSNKGAFL